MPSDSTGLRCGADSEVVFKRNLLFFNVTECASPNSLIIGCKSPSICVELCPDHDFNFADFKPENILDIRRNIFCLNGLKTGNASYNDFVRWVNDKKCIESYYDSRASKVVASAKNMFIFYSF